VSPGFLEGNKIMRSLNWTAEGGSVSRAEALASALSDATSKPANGWLRALAARLPTAPRAGRKIGRHF